MNAAESGVVRRLPGFVETVIVGGLIAGVLDGLDAIVYFRLAIGASAVRIFQSVASGAFGAAAFQGGARMALYGVFFHFVVALGIAAAYFVLCRIIPVIVTRPYLSGTVFGLIAFAVMFQIVLPLSAVRARKNPMGMPEFLNELFAHVVLVGIPIALCAYRSTKSRNQFSTRP